MKEEIKKYLGEKVHLTLKNENHIKGYSSIIQYTLFTRCLSLTRLGLNNCKNTYFSTIDFESDYLQISLTNGDRPSQYQF